MVRNKNSANQKKIIHPYLPAQVNKVEKWLKEQTENGWNLVATNRWKFVFAKCQPHHSEYFMYSGFDSSKGWSYDYHSVKRKYAKKNEPINKVPNEVFKADVSKVDDLFIKYKRSRNLFYKKHYIYLTLFSALFATCSCVICFLEPRTYFLLIAWLIIFIYATVSVAIVSSDIK